MFGLAPAFRSTHVDLAPALKEGTRSSAAEGRSGGRWFSLGNGLVVAQVALAVVVLVGAGLLVRTLQNLRNVDPGFDTRNLLTFRLDPNLIGYKTPQVEAFYRDLQERIGAIPGVESVSYSNSTLLSGSLWNTGFHLEGTPKDQNSEADYLPGGRRVFLHNAHATAFRTKLQLGGFCGSGSGGGKGKSAGRRAESEGRWTFGSERKRGSSGERGKGTSRAGDREQGVRAEIFSECESVGSSFWRARGRCRQKETGQIRAGRF